MTQNNPDLNILLKTDNKIDIELLVEIIKTKLDQDKIENIKIFYIGNQTSMASYVILGSGTSSKHIAVAAEKLADKVEETFGESLDISMEGNNKNAQWILIDLQDIIIHLFTKEMRDYYNLEELYSK
jgi:ribosome-associated protein